MLETLYVAACNNPLVFLCVLPFVLLFTFVVRWFDL